MAYENLCIGKLLRENTYPGRGIIAGLTPDGKKAVTAYFIMGRSANSRNRVFSLKEKAFLHFGEKPCCLRISGSASGRAGGGFRSPWTDCR